MHVERGDDAATLASRPVFPSPNNPTRPQPLSNMAMLTLLRRMKYDDERHYSDATTVHGACRSTFSTFARERTKFKDSIVEAALAHAEKNAVAAAYSRAEIWRERVALAHAWEKFATIPNASNVVKFPAAG